MGDVIGCEEEEDEKISDGFDQLSEKEGGRWGLLVRSSVDISGGERRRMRRGCGISGISVVSILAEKVSSLVRQGKCAHERA